MIPVKHTAKVLWSGSHTTIPGLLQRLRSLTWILFQPPPASARLWEGAHFARGRGHDTWSQRDGVSGLLVARAWFFYCLPFLLHFSSSSYIVFLSHLPLHCVACARNHHGHLSIWTSKLYLRPLSHAHSANSQGIDTMPRSYYSSDSDSDDYKSRGRRRPSAHRHRSDRKSQFLGADLNGTGLYRTRSQGASPAPVVNVFNDVAADARTETSRSPPYRQRAPSSRRDRLGSDLINEIEDLTLENRRLRSRSRGRSAAGFSSTTSAERYEWELRQREKELREIEKQKQWDAEKKRYEQDYELKKIEDDKERKRIIAE